MRQYICSEHSCFRETKRYVYEKDLFSLHETKNFQNFLVDYNFNLVIISFNLVISAKMTKLNYVEAQKTKKH